MFVYVTTKRFVPKKHPLRTLKPLVDAALQGLRVNSMPFTPQAAGRLCA